MPATLEQSHDFRLCIFDSKQRWLDQKHFTVTYNMFSLADDSDHLKQSQHQNAAYLKLNYFILNHIDQAMAISMTEMPMAAKFLSEYDNQMMVLPDLDNVTILEALTKKFVTLCGTHTMITSVSLKDHGTGIKYNFFYDDEETTFMLPTVKEWLGELSFWDEPWWDRYDVLTFDNVAQDEQELEEHKTDKEGLEGTRAPLDDIDDKVVGLLSGVKDQYNKENGIEKPEGELISLDAHKKKKGKWKPTIV